MIADFSYNSVRYGLHDSWSGWRELLIDIFIKKKGGGREIHEIICLEKFKEKEQTTNK